MYAISTYCCERASSKPRYFAGADALLAITAVVLAVIVFVKCGAGLNSIGDTGAGIMLGAGVLVVILDYCRARYLSKKWMNDDVEGLCEGGAAPANTPSPEEVAAERLRERVEEQQPMLKAYQANPRPAIAFRQLTIKMLDDTTFKIDGFRTDSTVAELKQAIMAKQGFPIERQIVIYAGMQLINDFPIGVYTFQEEVDFHLVVRNPQSSSS